MTDFRARVILEAAVGSYVNGIQQARAATDRLQNGVMANQAALLKVGATMAAVGGVTVRELGRMGNESAQFTSTITKMVTQVGLARDEAYNLGAAAMSLTATGRGPQELGEALFFVTSAGLRGSEALGVLQSSARASAIGLGDTAVVADLVTSAVNAYGSETLSASNATDVLIGAVREGKAEAPALAGALGRVLPIASEMGVQFHEVGAAVAAMTRTGTDAATATTQLRAVLVGLLNPAQGVEQAMSDLGLSSEQVRRVIREDGLWAAMMMLRDAVGDNEQALGQLFPNVRALAGFLDLTGANAEANARTFENLADSTGNMSAAFAEWALTTEAAQSRFSAAMEAVRISIGGDVEPAMRSMLDTGTGLALLFGDLPDPLRQAGTAAAGAAGGLALAAGSATLLLVAAAHVRSAMQTLGLSMGRVVGFAFNPWVLAIGAVVTALGIFAARKAQARQRVEQFTEAIKADSGELGENTRALAANELERRGLMETAQTLGLDLGLVTDAALGEADALAQVNAVIDEVLGAKTDLEQMSMQLAGAVDEEEQAAARLRDQLGEVTGELDESQAAAARFAEAMDESGDAADGATGDIDVLAGEMAELAGETNTAADALDNWHEALRAATDPVFSLRRSLSQYREAQEAANEAVKKYGEDSQEAKDAQWDLFEASSTLFAELHNGSLSFDEATAAIDAMRNANILSQGEADALKGAIAELRGEAEEFDGDYMAHLQAELDEPSLRHAQAELDRVARLRDPEYRAKLDEQARRQVGRGLDDVARARRPEYRPRVDPGTRQTAQSWLDRVGATRRPQYRPNVDSASRRAAESTLNYLARNRTMTVRVTTAGNVVVNTAGGHGRAHSGGLVTASGVIPRMHGGGTVGSQGRQDRLASDEVLTILQTDERVLSRAQNRAFEQMVSTLGRPAPRAAASTVGLSSPMSRAGGGSGGGTQVVELRLVGSGALYEQFKEGVRTGQLRLTAGDVRVRVG